MPCAVVSLLKPALGMGLLHPFNGCHAVTDVTAVTAVTAVAVDLLKPALGLGLLHPFNGFLLALGGVVGERQLRLGCGEGPLEGMDGKEAHVALLLLPQRLRL